MRVDRVLRRIADADDASFPNPKTDWLDIDHNARGRVYKGSTRNGQPIAVLLPRGQRLQHGDVLLETAEQMLVVNVRPCELIVATPPTLQQAMQLALELGNLHAPVQVTANELLFLEDLPAMELLHGLQIPFRRECRRFEPTQITSGTSVSLASDLQITPSGQTP